ncbi:MAG: RNA polymerase sigma factor [Polyangiaceae bacterium]|nr:RNA polymerase sigma factor [Polyangiaceae bacterium]
MTQGVLTLRAIYDEHVSFVWRALRRLGVRESDLPDAVQDVFLVVHRKLPEFEGRSKMTTWLFGIAMRVARDRMRLAHVRRQVGDEEAVLAYVDENADVAAQAERRQAVEILESILDALPMEQRAVFTLFELDGMSGEAIAELLEIPLGTVYSRLRLAREAFQRSVTRLRARQDRPPPPRVSAVRSKMREVSDEPSDEGIISPRRVTAGGAA